MRFEFSRYLKSARVGEHTVAIQDAHGLFRTGYQWTWLDGSRMEIQITANQLGIQMLRNGAILSTATFDRCFIDWQSRGYVWTYQGQEYSYRMIRRWTSLEGLREESTHQLLAAWSSRGCRTVGVLSPALSLDLSAVAFGMVGAHLLIARQS